MSPLPPIIDIDGILISSDLLTECFCCDYEKCKGICCVEGDAGAPVTMDEVSCMEERLDTVWPMLTASAQSVIDRQGVAYTDQEGDLVTSIVRGKECVFAKEENGCWLCMLEKAYRTQHPTPSTQHPTPNTQHPTPSTQHPAPFIKPISCALYPIREKHFKDGLVGLNYHRWEVCREGRERGKALGLPVYRFLEEPLVRRFGQAWYDELCEVAKQLGV